MSKTCFYIIYSNKYILNLFEYFKFSFFLKIISYICFFILALLDFRLPSGKGLTWKKNIYIHIVHNIYFVCIRIYNRDLYKKKYIYYLPYRVELSPPPRPPPFNMRYSFSRGDKMFPSTHAYYYCFYETWRFAHKKNRRLLDIRRV